MPLDPRTIANKFLTLNDSRAFNQMWLQKLAYLAHGGRDQGSQLSRLAWSHRGCWKKCILVA